jgi:hypothetical protein
VTLVTDIPTWKDHPFPDVPASVEIRRGTIDGEERIIFWSPSRNKHVDVLALAIVTGQNLDHILRLLS